ncbi:MAG: (E)-4-hydroxy-3-methylbut-2-enyl-diphosphate synthase [Rikenellaceae bacterium]|jgi:(E)-4-hydroxy-3-methylbut-2-enyl-diphosphate synthase|nr:(E)-4-hydroxy-3-methylbut-2-enyl-diphosphate synthase [Rikenellaceae bacterium]
MEFCDSLTAFSRARTVEVRVGDVVIGGGRPVVLQSMTNTSTMDTAASAAQIRRIHAAGGQIVRLTTPSVREAQNMKAIAAATPGIPLVADVHFTPEVALVAADHVDKVRINPGNFRRSAGLDGQPGFAEFEELIEKCRTRGVAIRIGVNHGSLAPAIVDKYGDTPQGMVESAMEFLNVCRRMAFDQVVVSMKSSNVRVMVHAYRLLVARMRAEGMAYPLHLGVTEAGDGMQGRVKSAVGIGALMADGLGDTIRVSLSEDPEREIPVAALLRDHFAARAGAVTQAGPDAQAAIPPIADPSLYSPYEYRPRASAREGLPFLRSEVADLTDIVVLETRTANPTAEWRTAILNMMAAGDRHPVMLHRRYPAGTTLEALQVLTAADMGLLFLDGLADGLWIECEGVAQADIDAIGLHILQASRVRISRTEYIACPGCGRTQYDLQGTLAAIRARTGHLTGLKIGVMGCIVNGPGEMADADYGYVGSGPGRVTLYRGREVVRRGVPEAEAIDALLELIATDRPVNGTV